MLIAAAFFSTYEAMKKNSPLPAHLAPLSHMISASVAEVVRTFRCLGRFRSDFHDTGVIPGCLLDPSANRSHQDSHANVDLRDVGAVIFVSGETSPV